MVTKPTVPLEVRLHTNKLLYGLGESDVDDETFRREQAIGIVGPEAGLSLSGE